MVALRYSGRLPLEELTIVHKGWVDGRWNSLYKVDPTFVTTRIATITPSLVSEFTVDTADAALPAKTAVDTADTAYAAATLRGNALGVASIGPDFFIPSAQVPSGLAVDRVPVCYSSPTLIMGSTHTVALNSTNQEYLAATMAIADPGWPYYLFVGGTVSGQTGGADPGDGLGKDPHQFGQAVVFDDVGSNVYARAVTSSNFNTTTYPLLPWADAVNDTGGLLGPASVPVLLSGARTLQLWLSMFNDPSMPSGATYTFNSSGLTLDAVVFSGLP